MNTIRVELAGTSPCLHNRCWTDGSGWQPMTDLEQAESRLFTRTEDGFSMPWNRPVIAIGRAAWSWGVLGPEWPMEIMHAEAASEVLSASTVVFEGEWTPHVFRREGLPLVALPRFDEWSATFDLRYDPAWHRAERLREMLDHSGRHVGLPQFAPFAGKGPWGRFEVAAWEPSETNLIKFPECHVDELIKSG